jgi:hypothetical protein
MFDAKIPSRQKAAAIIELLNNHSKLDQLRKNILKCADPQALRILVEQIIQLAG